MATRLINIDRHTPLLLPPDLRDWVAKDDLVHFILEAVDLCDLSRAPVNVRGSGHAQYPPSMMLALLIFGYAHEIFSSRRLERATHSHVGLRYICTNHHPDHDTIATFRRQNGPLLEECFVRVLELARELKAFTHLGTISIDGTKIAGRATRWHNRTLSALEAEIAALKTTIHERLQQAELADLNEVATDRLPVELQNQQALKAQLEAAKAELQARHRVAKVQRQAQTRGEIDPEDPGVPSCLPPGEPRPAPESPAKRDAKRAINLLDAESRWLRDAQGRMLQGFNAQLAVDSDPESRSQLIVGVHLSQEATDRRLLKTVLAQVPAALLAPEVHVLADKGYANADLIAQVEATPGCTVLCPPQNDQAPTGTSYRETKLLKRRRALDEAMRARLQEPANRKLYHRRSGSIEPVFGVLKNVLGFKRFRMFGLAKSQIELTLLAVAYNLRRLAQTCTLDTLEA